jgi:hypothetical protein
MRIALALLAAVFLGLSTWLFLPDIEAHFWRTLGGCLSLLVFATMAAELHKGGP